MDTVEMIRELRRLHEVHKNDRVDTFQVNWSNLCKDVANKLEDLDMQNRLMTSILQEHSPLEELRLYLEYAYDNAKKLNDLEVMNKVARALVALQADTSMDIFKEDILDELATID